ncbi:MAG: NADPH-dependent FMN reductase [Pelagibacterium sp. SCN 64-44]|nr:MAG: NADPH-dependent FMN reductase [Pelagibacterium sp. SCN 64-44]
MNILGISGSLRHGSYNTALLHAAGALMPDGANLEVFPISGFPEYNDDVRAAGLPVPVAAFREAVRAADGLLFVTPEYNRSIPGMLKNAIDWISRPPEQPFNNKPVAIMGASRGKLGTIMANHHLRQILVYLNAQMVNGAEVLVGEAALKFDAEGKLTDEATARFIAEHLLRLKDLILRTRG